MITWLKLEMYSLKQKEHEYAALLQAVVNVFFRHTEASVLDACARVMHHCSTVAFGKNNKCFFLFCANLRITRTKEFMRNFNTYVFLKIQTVVHCFSCFALKICEHIIFQWLIEILHYRCGYVNSMSHNHAYTLHNTHVGPYKKSHCNQFVKRR